ncbi:MAG TPA: fatty acid desaturase, partial [Gammaproteobacteria bacterium]|nr:fatty acid desaturase [Gammaproteobacteria bacterium]
MADSRENSRLSEQARQHQEMRRVVLRQHPEAARLAGPQHLTALAAPLLLVIHWSIAALVSDSNILIVFVTAFFAGQLVIHAAGALVHETAHKLVFRKRLPKLLFDLNLELIIGSFGKQLTYQHEHVSSHHPYMGNYERDYEHEDICGYLARQKYIQHHPKYQRLVTVATLLVHLLPFGFILADEIFPRFYRYVTRQEVTDKQRDIGATRPSRFDQNLFIAVSLLANIILFVSFGFLGWLYHNWSLSLFLGKCGISNLGQSLSEHDGIG